jgi:hypothetical protein
VKQTLLLTAVDGSLLTASVMILSISDAIDLMLTLLSLLSRCGVIVSVVVLLLSCSDGITVSAGLLLCDESSIVPFPCYVVVVYNQNRTDRLQE